MNMNNEFVTAKDMLLSSLWCTSNMLQDFEKRFVICSESYGGGISDAPTAVLGESEESGPTTAGLYVVNFVHAI